MVQCRIYPSNRVPVMKIIKSATLAASLLAASTSFSHAGGFAEPIMEPEVIAEEAAGTAGGFVLPLILLAVLAAVAAGGGGGGGGGAVPPPVFR